MKATEQEDNTQARSPRDLIAPGALAAAGAATAWLYYWGGDLHRFTQGITAYISLFIGHFALYLAACYAVMRRTAPAPRLVTFATLALILIFGAVFRAQLAGERPYLSSDTYRYVWDGRVQAAGINPYRYIPSAPEIEHLRDDNIYPKINRGDYAPTPYPPIAQATYLAVYLAYPLSVTAFKVAMSLFDLLSMILIMLALARAGLDPARVIIFAWHPLLIFEGAHSGHVESVFIAFLAMALAAWSYKKYELAGVGIGLATMVKFYPAMLLPAFLFSLRQPARLSDWPRAMFRSLTRGQNIRLILAFLATILIAYLPYLSVGSNVLGYLPRELQEEGYTDGGSRYFILGLIRTVLPLPTWAFVGAALIALSGMCAWVLVRAKRDEKDVARGALAIIGLFLALTTPRYPWYYAWMIPYLCFVPRAGWLYLTGATVLLYLLWFIPNVYPDLPLWLGASLYAPTAALLAWQALRAREQGVA